MALPPSELVDGYAETLGDVRGQVVKLFSDVEIFAQLGEFAGGVVIHVLDDLGEALRHLAVAIVLTLLIVLEAVVEFTLDDFGLCSERGGELVVTDLRLSSPRGQLVGNTGRKRKD